MDAAWFRGDALRPLSGPVPCGRIVAPIVLGCCPDTPRCALCNPPPAPRSAEFVAAMVTHYRRDRAGSDGGVVAGFYGGPAPSDDHLDALDGAPFRVRVRPDLLTRAETARLVSRGVESIELDAWTFDDAVLRSTGRHYGRRLLLEQLDGLRVAGVGVGIVLVPGLPGTDHASAVIDARIAATRVDFARIHPALVLAGSRLREAHVEGRYRPLDLGAAVTVCRAMMDVLEGEGVTVIRVGVQPGPDEVGPVVAGPAHTSLRELVEARRALDHLRGLLDATTSGSHIVVRCAPGDETRTRGPRNQNLRTLRAERALASLRILPDPAFRRGTWRIDVVEPE